MSLPARRAAAARQHGADLPPEVRVEPAVEQRVGQRGAHCQQVAAREHDAVLAGVGDEQLEGSERQPAATTRTTSCVRRTWTMDNNNKSNNKVTGT